MSQAPVHSIKLGRIKASIWRNDTERGTRYSVQIVKLYLEEGQWKQTQSFGRDELLLVAKVADQAHSWIYEEASGNTEAIQG